MINLPHWDQNRFRLPADHNLLSQLTKEMRDSNFENGKPAKFWMLPEELKSAEMEKVLNAWCGLVGEIPLKMETRIKEVSGSEATAKELFEFVKAIDHSGIIKNETLLTLAEKNWRYMDIGSLMDILLLTAFFDIKKQKKIKILEIGGGFGRLVEFFFHSSSAKIQYVNVDAVPISLMYSYLYLKKMFPTKKICLATKSSRLEKNYDILILPAWNLFMLADAKFDMAINIESMQEMNQGLVDFYLNYLNKATCLDGLIYLVNSRDYKFQGEWNIPKNWKCLLRHRTPRSWTKNHPAEIFLKTRLTKISENKIRQAFYSRELMED